MNFQFIKKIYECLFSQLFANFFKKPVESNLLLHYAVGI